MKTRVIFLALLLLFTHCKKKHVDSDSSSQAEVKNPDEQALKLTEEDIAILDADLSVAGVFAPPLEGEKVEIESFSTTDGYFKANINPNGADGTYYAIKFSNPDSETEERIGFNPVLGLSPSEGYTLGQACVCNEFTDECSCGEPQVIDELAAAVEPPTAIEFAQLELWEQCVLIGSLRGELLENESTHWPEISSDLSSDYFLDNKDFFQLRRSHAAFLALLNTGMLTCFDRFSDLDFSVQSTTSGGASGTADSNTGGDDDSDSGGLSTGVKWAIGVGSVAALYSVLGVILVVNKKARIKQDKILAKEKEAGRKRRAAELESRRAEAIAQKNLDEEAARIRSEKLALAEADKLLLKFTIMDDLPADQIALLRQSYTAQEVFMNKSLEIYELAKKDPKLASGRASARVAIENLKVQLAEIESKIKILDKDVVDVSLEAVQKVGREVEEVKLPRYEGTKLPKAVVHQPKSDGDIAKSADDVAGAAGRALLLTETPRELAIRALEATEAKIDSRLHNLVFKARILYDLKNPPAPADGVSE